MDHDSEADELKRLVWFSASGLGFEGSCKGTRKSNSESQKVGTWVRGSEVNPKA